MARRRRKAPPDEEPSKPRPVQPLGERDIVVLFADVVGCSEISNHKEIKDYNDFINSFQQCFKSVCGHYKQAEYEENERPFFQAEARGDEGCLKIFVPNRDDLSRDIDVAINIALDLKRKWLLEKENKGRIDNGLLPVDVGIGIHSGKVWVNKEKDERGNDKYRPEGYAINLTKRIESESRGGKFTHILVSESARGQLYNLKDECTYRFDTPFTINPRGISRDIKVFEIKHHFLPTDWTEEPTEVSMVYRELEPTRAKLEISKKAYDINPMNLWIAEEYVLLSVMQAYKKLDKEKKVGDVAALRKAYWPALGATRQITNSNLRDAGLLALLGFVLGEQKNYSEEQQMYVEGLEMDEQDALLHWYLGYSISCEIDDKQQKQKNVKIAVFYNETQEKIEKILKAFERALELMPMNAWIVYDFACELSWWSQVHERRFRSQAIGELIRAFALNPETKKRAKEEKYLKPIIDDPKVKKYLEG